MSRSAWKEALLLHLDSDHYPHENTHTPTTDKSSLVQSTPPTSIHPVPQLLMDLYALHTFFNSDTPPEINVRRSDITVILYGFGDASGSGFG